MYLRMVSGTPESKLCLKSLVYPSHFLSALISLHYVFRLRKTKFYFARKVSFLLQWLSQCLLLDVWFLLEGFKLNNKAN